MKINDVTGTIIESAIQVHRALGPGLLESAYEACLLFELHRRALAAERQVPLPITYESIQIDAGFRSISWLKDVSSSN